MLRKISLPLVVLSFLLLAPSLVRAGAYLVKDIDPAGTGAGSSPVPFVTLDGGISLWLASDDEHGRELWRTDGTAAGTYLLLDGLPDLSFGTYTLLAKAGDRAFFLRTESYTSDEVWVTGGTPGDTFRLSEPLIVPREHPQAVWVPSQQLLFFRAGDSDSGEELWRSDGTPGGTYQVADVRPGPEGSDLAELTEFHGKVFFRANDGSRGAALWSTDGTATGTRLVRAVRAAPAGAPALDPAGLTALGSRLLFFGVSAAAGRELWVSDGTARGTRALGNFIPGAAGMSGSHLAVANGRLWFVGTDPARGEELWVTNGTAGGTRRLTNYPDSRAFTGLGLDFTGLWVGSRFIFPVNDSVHGQELWASDGTVSGTRILRDIFPGAPPSLPYGPLLLGGRLYFAAWDLAHGLEPWSTDGTTAGTRLAGDVCPGSCPSYPTGFQGLGKQVLFGANDGVHDFELWKIQGRRIVRLSDLDEPLEFEFVSLPAKGSIVFPQSEEATGKELWRSDGTQAGTRLLWDVNPAITGGSNPTRLQHAAGKLWFLTERPEPALWTSDGTAAGTVEVHRFSEDEVMPNLKLVELGGLAFFVMQSGATDPYALWRSDGSEAGTFRVSPEEAQIPFNHQPAAAGDRVYFSGQDGELWTTDGTVEGTDLVIDLATGQLGSELRDLTAFAGRIFFSAGAFNDRTVWSSDGTPEGTEEVGDLSLSQAKILGVHAGRLWFLASSPDVDLGLWSTDGTTAGTHRLDVPSFVPFHLFSAGNLMFLPSGNGLWVSDGTPEGTRNVGPAPWQTERWEFALLGQRLFYSSQAKLWVTDGTAAGTHFVVNLAGNGSVGYLTTFAGQVYFTVGPQIWRTDGTAAGTVLVTLPGGARQMREPTVSAGRLFFQATDPAHGTELWALE
jgi:ELWxxDGT repeat protein